MGKVHKKIDSERDLTVYTIVGKITAKEIMEAIQEFYGSQVTRKVLWDLSKGDASDLTSSEVRSIVQTPRKG